MGELVILLLRVEVRGIGLLAYNFVSVVSADFPAGIRSQLGFPAGTSNPLIRIG